MILCYTKTKLLAVNISHSVKVLLISCCQSRGAEPQLSIGLILMAMLHCSFLAGAVHSLLKLQFANKLDEAEKLWFFQIESENSRGKKNPIPTKSQQKKTPDLLEVLLLPQQG